MSDEAKQSLALTVGDQTFRVRVAPGEEARLQHAAELADHVLRDVLDGGVVGGPRAYAMALFELAVELDEAREALHSAQQNRQRLGALIDRLDSALK